MKHSRQISTFTQRIVPKSKDPLIDRLVHSQIEDFWKNEIGMASLYTFPQLHQSGRLVILCTSPVWYSQVRNQKPSILKQLRELNFPVTSIDIKVIPARNPPKTSIKHNEHVIPLSAKTSRNIVATSKKINNPALKASLLKLAGNAKKNRLGN